MTSIRLVELPLDAAEVIVKLLETEDLTVLASVCRAIASRTVYNPLETKTLHLPRTDQGRARRLLQQFDPTRLARLACIEIARAWQVDLFVEANLTTAVTRLRVQPDATLSRNLAAAIARRGKPPVVSAEEICVKLDVFLNLTSLEVAETKMSDISSLGHLTNLRKLSFHKIGMVDGRPLAALVHLEEFMSVDSRIDDLSCIQAMTQLRRLEVTHVVNYITSFPSLSPLVHLQSLTLGQVVVEDANNFIQTCTKLQYLSLESVIGR